MGRCFVRNPNFAAIYPPGHRMHDAARRHAELVRLYVGCNRWHANAQAVYDALTGTTKRECRYTVRIGRNPTRSLCKMDVGWLSAITLEVEVKNRLSIASAVAATLLLGSVILTPLAHTRRSPDAPYHPIHRVSTSRPISKRSEYARHQGRRRNAQARMDGLCRHDAAVDAGGEPVWETCMRRRCIYAPATGAQLQGLHRRRLRSSAASMQRRGARPQRSGANVASFTLFNGDTRDWVQKNALYSTSALDTLNKRFYEFGTARCASANQEFPNKR